MGDRDLEKETFPDPGKNRSGLTDSNVLFLGSLPMQKNILLRWRWRLEDRELKTSHKEEAEKIAGLLETASRGKGLAAAEFFSSLGKITRPLCGTDGLTKDQNDNAKVIWTYLRENGLAVYPVPPGSHTHGIK